MNVLSMKKKDAIATFKQKLATDARWAIRGLVTIYAYQTREEQFAGDTRVNNGVGFTGTDGQILSSLADQAQRRNLSEKQMALVFKKMPKYAGQLYRVAKEKAEKDNVVAG